MKRLIKKASSKTLYHATSMESLFSIMESGELRPQEIQVSDFANIENIDRFFDGDVEEYNKMMSRYVGYTFFAADQGTAQGYGARAAGKSNINNFYAIIIAELDEEVLMPDLNDAPNATTWEESIQEVSQVSVLGSVSIDKMTGLIIVENTYIHMSLNTTFETWKDDLKKEMAKQVRSGYLDVNACADMWDQLGIPYNPGIRDDD